MANDKDSIFQKHLGVILTSLVSLAAVVVSATQVWVANINKQKEIEITLSNQIEQQARMDQEKERKWKLDMLEFVMENEERIFSDDMEKRNRIRDIMIVTFPREFTKIVFSRLEQTESATQKEKTTEENAKTKTWIQGQEKIDQAVTEEAKKLIVDSSELAQKFKSDERKIFSDKLVDLYQSKGDQVVAVLINSILPESDYWSYRVNLYIALTLEKIRSGWKGTETEIEAIRNLKKTRNYRDATFKKRVDGAINNYKGKS